MDALRWWQHKYGEATERFDGLTKDFPNVSKPKTEDEEDVFSGLEDDGTKGKTKDEDEILSDDDSVIPAPGNTKTQNGCQKEVPKITQQGNSRQQILRAQQTKTMELHIQPEESIERNAQNMQAAPSKLTSNNKADPRSTS